MATEKIIQFGEGGFLRGFADWMLQHINEKTDFDGKVVVVQPLELGRCDMLEEQGCVYTHICRGAEGVEDKKVEVISRCVNPFNDYDAFLKLAENKDFRFVISNTTEAGITYCAEDTQDLCPKVSFPAKVTVLLKRRFDLGLDGFVFLPCELIDKNGEKLKEIVLKYANDWELGEDFIKWVNEKNIFCNTLVDRIVPGYPKGEDIVEKYNDNLLNTSEYFHLWVIEGYKDICKEIPFDKAGLNVVVTDNLRRYRDLKVHILNGAHTSVVHYALLEGLDTVKSCMDDEKMSAFIKSTIFEEIIPTLDADKEEAEDYANSVLARCCNPYIRHMLVSITLNSVSKFRVRVLPSLLGYKEKFGKLPKNLVLSLAMLIKYYKTREPNDDAGAVEFIKSASVKEILQNTELWGTDLGFLAEEVEKYADK